MDLELKEKIAVVVGGSSGIGLAVAHTLASEGVKIAIAGRDLAKAQAAAIRVGNDTGSQVIAVQTDTGIDASVKSMRDEVINQFGSVDILVNCAAEPAGQSRPPQVEEVTREQLERQMNVKVMGYLRCAQAFIPFMRDNNWGRIISLGGLGARNAWDMIGTIRNISVVAMSKNLAEELAGTGITATVVHPGMTKTERVSLMIENRANDERCSYADIETKVAGGTLNGYLPTPEDVASVVAFLASPRSSAINGDVIAAGGGNRGAIFY